MSALLSTTAIGLIGSQPRPSKLPRIGATYTEEAVLDALRTEKLDSLRRGSAEAMTKARANAGREP